MSALTTALAGGYVNFGVFALYGDKALDNALETVLKLAFNVSAFTLAACISIINMYFGMYIHGRHVS